MNIKPITEWGVNLKSPLIISGPCSAETEEQVLSTAVELKQSGIQIYRAGVWKPRTRPNHFEGVGSKALQWLQTVKKETGMQISTEVAHAEHVELALKAEVDILWIGARTSVNPFAVQSIADALQGVDCTVLVKNPINPDLNLWIGAIERIHGAGIEKLGGIHRGFSRYEPSPYRNSPLWEIPLELKRQLPNLPLLCDPSHISGCRNLIKPIAQKALSLNFDGLMIESHCNPHNAWSDAKQQITPREMGLLMEHLNLTKQFNHTNLIDLEDLRYKIDEYDRELLDILGQRFNTALEIGKYKQKNGIGVVQTNRWDNLLKSRIESGKNLDLNKTMIQSLFELIHKESIRKQQNLS